MSLIIMNVDEVRRTLSASGGAFVAHDKEVDIVRFAINSGFADIVLDGQVALRVMYQRPGETEVRAQTLTYYDTDGLHNYYDWQLSQSDLTKDGSLMVALCILDISGGEVSEWHTTPCAVRVLSTIHTDDSDEGDAEVTPTVKERVAVLESMIQRVASGAPIVVASTSAMTDTEQIYVLSTDGNWYYHNGTAWTVGGEYGAVATDTTLTQSGIPADAAAVGDMKYLLDEISAINLNQIEWAPTIAKGYYLSLSQGKNISSPKYARTNVLWPGSDYKDAVSFDNSDYEFCVAFYGANGATDGTDYIRSTGYIAGGTSTIYIPPEAKKFGISFRREDQANLTDEDITAISEALKCYVIGQKPADASLDPLSTNAIQNAPVATEFNSVWDDLNKFKAKNLSSVDWNPSIRKGYYIKREGSNAGQVLSSPRYAYVTLPRWGAGVWEAVSVLDSTYEFWVAYYTEDADITGRVGYLGCSEILTGGTVSHIPDTAIKFSMCFRRADQAELTDDDIITIQSALVYYQLTADVVKEIVDSLDRQVCGFYTSDDATITPTTFDGVIALYDALMASRPDYVTKNTLTSGNLTNYEYVFTSGNYNVNSGAGRNPDPMIAKPVILILAGIHGREKVGVMALYRIMKELCGNNYALADLINYVTIKVIPVGNPWGYTNNKRHNANDVDLNRNFATSTWGDYNPGEPGSYNYAGPSAGSEDETKIIQAWLTANSDAAFYIDYHNSAFASEVIEIGGPDTDESMIFKKKFLLAINKIIPYWQKARNMDSSSNYYCYTGGEGTVEGRASRNYAYEAGIHLAYTCETSENVNSTGLNSLATINVGAEAVGNFLLGMTDYYKEI